MQKKGYNYDFVGMWVPMVKTGGKRKHSEEMIMKVKVKVFLFKP